MRLVTLLLALVVATTANRAAFATMYYVTPAGAGAQDGSSWADAFGNLQDAIDVSDSGDVIYLQSGVYTAAQPDAAELSQYLITNKDNLTISGGYAGSGNPGNRDGGSTVLQRDPASTRRIINASGSEITFDTITIDDGKLTASGSQGAGLLLTDCNITLTNCIVRNNSMSGGGGVTYYGGAIYTSGGSLTLDNCFFGTNFVYSGSDDSPNYGGALAAYNTAVTINASRFDQNYTQSPYKACRGGALFLSGGNATISDSHFTTNRIVCNDGNSQPTPYGGAIHANGLSRFILTDSYFAGNYSRNYKALGGAVYMEGAAQKAHIERCVFTRNGQAGHSGSVHLQSGTLTAVNILIAKTGVGSGLSIAGGNATVMAATFAANKAFGAQTTGGSLTLSHSIFRDNIEGSTRRYGGTLNIAWSCAPEALDGSGNFIADPLFADTIYYHPRSRAGYYAGGFFGGGTWVADPTDTSPTIDAAAPETVWDNEPQPNGHWANIGYDANTPVASKSYLGEPPVATTLAAYTYPPTNITETTAWARGEVAHCGDAEDPDVYLVWGTEDKGTTSTDAWLPNVRHLGTQPLWHLFASQLTGLTAGTWYYRLYVTNSTGSAWSAPGVTFETARLPEVNDLAITHISRHAATVNFDAAYAGGEGCDINLYYWLQDAPVTSSIAIGPRSGSVVTPLSPLSIGTNYGVRIIAVSGAGTTVKTINFATLGAAPITRYVTTEGGGIYDGSDWANAYSNLQDAINVSPYAGDVIYMKSGTYTQTQPDLNESSHYLVANVAGLTISGGYAGSGAPGSRDGGSTILKRDASAFRRILRADSSSLNLDHITIADGRLRTTGSQGAGLNLVNSHTIITNCTFIGNKSDGSGYGAAIYYGGAIYARNGTLSLADCQMLTNSLYNPSNDSPNYGGAIYADNVGLSLTNCRFDRNYVYNIYKACQGGALYLNNGQAVISSCTFTTNYVTCHDSNDQTIPRGGAIFANGLSRLHISDSFFSGSYANNPMALGGVLYLSGAAQKSILERCIFTKNGQAGNSGNIYLLNGSLTATNLLFAGNSKQHAFYVAGGNLSLFNATVADNTNAGLYVNGGNATVSHSIFYNNAYIDATLISGSLAVDYSCMQTVHTGTGNFVADPLFADTTYYHPRSRAGHYTGGFFGDGAWGADPSETSPTIDAAAAGTAWDNEPQPNRHWANIGYDANTATASKSDLGEPPVAAALAVYAYAPTNISASAAWARGEVAHSGDVEDPDVYLVWGSADHGTASLDAWQPNVRHLGAKPPWHLFASELTDLAPGTHYYRLYAINSSGSAWSVPAATFETERLPEVSGLTVSHITRHTARALCNVAYASGEGGSVTLHYWLPEAPTTNSIAVGPADGQLVIPVTGLAANTNYTFKLVAANKAGSASATISFQTLATAPIACYVTPEGGGMVDGSNWANAFSNLQDAVDICLYTGDAIYLKHGTYLQIPANINDLEHYQIHNRPGLTISGGYHGDGAPGIRGAAETILKRKSGTNRRIINASGSTLTLDAIVIDDGKLTANNSQGAGLRLVNCTTVLGNCILRNNSMSGGGKITLYGGAIYTSGGSLTLDNCFFGTNFVYSGSDDSPNYGGALAAYNTVVTINASRFDQNYTQSPYKACRGGALFLSGGNATISDSHFTTNRIVCHDTNSQPTPYGGAIHANGLSRFILTDSYFAGNYSRNYKALGGAVYMEGAAQKARIERCVFTRNGQDGHSGSIHLASGALAITNALVVRNGKDAGIHIAGGTATMSHITTANNKGWGISKSAGSATLSSSIAWGNTGGGVNGCVTTYTCAQEVLAGDGNISEDPLFVDTTYYHLTSHGGHLVDGYFDGVTWERIKLDSPCIDAGDPAAPFGNEIRPHGSRANMGAYGNTSAASITYRLGATVILLR